jgi:hypothetical protein
MAAQQNQSFLSELPAAYVMLKNNTIRDKNTQTKAAFLRPLNQYKNNISVNT